MKYAATPTSRIGRVQLQEEALRHQALSLREKLRYQIFTELASDWESNRGRVIGNRNRESDPSLSLHSPRTQENFSGVNSQSLTKWTHWEIFQQPSEWQREPTYLPVWIEAPMHLKTVFPERDPERSPATIYYSQEGERKELEVPEASSWKASEGYTVPPGPWESKRKKATKRRKGIELEKAPIGRGIHLSNTLESKQPQDLQLAIEMSELVLARRTTPPLQLHFPNSNLPDALHGLAAPLSYGYGQSDSISQVKRQPKGPYSDYRYANWTQRAVIAETGSAKEDSTGFKRDRPPHMRETSEPGPTPPPGDQNQEGSYFHPAEALLRIPGVIQTTHPTTKEIEDGAPPRGPPRDPCRRDDPPTPNWRNDGRGHGGPPDGGDPPGGRGGAEEGEYPYAPRAWLAVNMANIDF
ncbi:hypothetical protein DFH09DRAFT_1104961 [Mycena vulgaris]|nr:hypothetical protein DFH09DRAFT_1104961 [Mycena vulgaris]